MSEFDEYIVHGEPGQKEKADAWQTAIGLQEVDGLKVSTYLLDTARQYISVANDYTSIRYYPNFLTKILY